MGLYELGNLHTVSKGRRKEKAIRKREKVQGSAQKSTWGLGAWRSKRGRADGKGET